MVYVHKYNNTRALMNSSGVLIAITLIPRDQFAVNNLCETINEFRLQRMSPVCWFNGMIVFVKKLKFC